MSERQDDDFKIESKGDGRMSMPGTVPDTHLLRVPAGDVLQPLGWGPVGPREVWFTITRDGDVVLAPGIDWTEAAKLFWREVERLAPDGRKLIRP